MLDFKPDFYKKLYQSLENSAVLMKVDPGGKYFPIWCSKEFAAMIEGTEEEFIQAENSGTLENIHPEDRAEVEYLFKNHVTKNLNIRRKTLTGKWIWVNVHYAFVEEDGELYVYCNYFDVTSLKKSEERAKNLYEGIRTELENLSNDSLVSLRLNLTKDIVEDCRGQENFAVDIKDFKISEHYEKRLKFFPRRRLQRHIRRQQCRLSCRTVRQVPCAKLRR